MKPGSISTLLLLTFLAFSCSKHSDPAPAASLVGSWKEATAVFSSCDNPADNRTETCTTNCPVWEFKADGTLFIEGNNAGTYTIDGNNISIAILSLPNTTLTSSINGSTLTISGFSHAEGSNGSGGVDMCSLALTYTKQ